MERHKGESKNEPIHFFLSLAMWEAVAGVTPDSTPALNCLQKSTQSLLLAPAQTQEAIALFSIRQKGYFKKLIFTNH